MLGYGQQNRTTHTHTYKQIKKDRKRSDTAENSAFFYKVVDNINRDVTTNTAISTTWELGWITTDG